MPAALSNQQTLTVFSHIAHGFTSTLVDYTRTYRHFNRHVFTALTGTIAACAVLTALCTERFFKTIIDKRVQVFVGFHPYVTTITTVAAIRAAFPCPVGPDGTVFKCVNLGWDVFNVEHRLSVLTGLRVKAGNDANVAALGEMWQGGGAGYQNIVMVTLGTGVGGGIIIDGRILPGINGAAGEIGHLPVEDDQPETCTCGNQGCLEQYSSATAVARSVQRYLDEHPEAETSLRSVQNIEAKDVFDAAKQDDKVALELTERACAYLGKGLAMIACVVNPEAFVIGGGMARAGEILMESVRRNFKQKAFHASRETEFKEAKLGNNAGIYGGVRMLLE